jgi:ubiquinone/menaquinone biosynthesis C-methylase UbiE
MKNSTITQEEVLAGQKIYNKKILKIYDWYVLGFSNTFVWRCPSALIFKQFKAFTSKNHLDIGVGTGYFLKKLALKPPMRLCLADLNDNSLAYCQDVLKHVSPMAIKHNVFEPLPTSLEPFSSMSINYLLHCLPGNLASKAIVFDHCKEKLLPGGVLFGSTIIQGDYPRNFMAKKLMKFYNDKGVFTNTEDRYADLEKILKEKFSSYQIKQMGCVALFSAVK